MKVTQEYMTTEQAAELINTSAGVVRYLCSVGTLEAEKMGKVWLVRRSSAEEYKARKDAGEIKPGVKKKSQ